MTALLLSPHNDDEVLFASYLCLRYHPHVIVCLRSGVQERYGVYASEREEETEEAMRHLGCTWEQWPYQDQSFDHFRGIGALRGGFEALAGQYDHCFAPAVELEGHEQHNLIGQLAREVFGDRITHYLTYTRDGGRSRDGVPNEPDEPEWIAAKMQALACYRSQLRVHNCRPWFYEQLDLREWIEHG